MVLTFCFQNRFITLGLLTSELGNRCAWDCFSFEESECLFSIILLTVIDSSQSLKVRLCHIFSTSGSWAFCGWVASLDGSRSVETSLYTFVGRGQRKSWLRVVSCCYDVSLLKTTSLTLRLRGGLEKTRTDLPPSLWLFFVQLLMICDEHAHSNVNRFPI